MKKKTHKKSSPRPKSREIVFILPPAKTGHDEMSGPRSPVHLKLKISTHASVDEIEELRRLIVQYPDKFVTKFQTDFLNPILKETEHGIDSELVKYLKVQSFLIHGALKYWIEEDSAVTPACFKITIAMLKRRRIDLTSEDFYQNDLPLIYTREIIKWLWKDLLKENASKQNLSRNLGPLQRFKQNYVNTGETLANDKYFLGLVRAQMTGLYEAKMAISEAPYMLSFLYHVLIGVIHPTIKPLNYSGKHSGNACLHCIAYHKHLYPRSIPS